MRFTGLKFLRDHGKTLVSVSIYPKKLGALELYPFAKGSGGELFKIFDFLDQGYVEKHVGHITKEGALFIVGYSIDDVVEYADEILNNPHFWESPLEKK